MAIDYEIQKVREAACALLQMEARPLSEIDPEVICSIKQEYSKRGDSKHQHQITKDAARALIRYDTYPHDCDDLHS